MATKLTEHNMMYIPKVGYNAANKGKAHRATDR